jgi:hypothetical protein
MPVIVEAPWMGPVKNPVRRHEQTYLMAAA